MVFAGLTAAQVGALFGVAALAALGLYMLKLRRRAVAVPFSMLWQRILRDKESTSLFSRLKRLLSLLLQLALIALIALAAGDPRAEESVRAGRQLVVLVDASASMQSTDVGPTRLDAALGEVRSLVRSLGGSDRMLIAQLDAQITPLGPMTSDTAELERAIDAIRATDTRADFSRGLRFATDTLRGAERGEIVLVSDGQLGEARDASGVVHLGDTKLTFIRVGEHGDNVAITQFAVRRYPLDKSRYEVMLEVMNTGEAPADVELKILGDGEIVDLSRIKLAAGERLPRFYPNLSGASRTLEAVIAPVGEAKDYLPADNHAYALLPERRRAKVLVVSAGNTYLEAALLLDEYLDVETIAPAEYPSVVARTNTYDVVVFDRVTPLDAPKTHALYLDPRGEGSPVAVGEEVDRPWFDKVDEKHPVTRFVQLSDVNIARGRPLKPKSGDHAIGVSRDFGPLLVAGARKGHRFVALGFDVSESDMPLRPAWPLLVLGAIGWFSDDDASYLSSLRTGEVWHVNMPEGQTHARVTWPDGRRRVVPVHDGKAVFVGDRAGFYEISLERPVAGTQAGADSNVAASFAANLLDETESTIEPAKEVMVDGKNADTSIAFHVGVRREIWIYLLLGVIAITLIEWMTYHRRVTV